MGSQMMSTSTHKTPLLEILFMSLITIKTLVMMVVCSLGLPVRVVVI